MPRPLPPSGGLGWSAAVICCAALGPEALHIALAAAAGTLFEAAPFVLAAEALPRGRLRALSGLAGCGCGGSLPGALAPSAIALCWFAFGPAVALGRTLAALGIVALTRRPAEANDRGDALTELLSLAPASAAAALASAAFARHAPFLTGSPVGLAGACCAGAILGYFAPCATAAVAIAAALAPHVPFAAAGVLATGGLIARDRHPRRARATPLPGPPPGARRWLARAGLTLALGLFALGGAPGFVNPRLRPFIWFGTLASAAALRRPSLPGAGVVPAVMLVALAAGSPEPAYTAAATEFEDGAFAGERVSFTGSVVQRGDATILERFAITCCRADASPMSVRIAVRLPVAAGAWVTARGTLEPSAAGLVLRPAAWNAMAKPADPFIYR